MGVIILHLLSDGKKHVTLKKLPFMRQLKVGLTP